MLYYVSYNGRAVGPMTVHQVLAYPVNDNTPISTDGANWKPLYNFPELMQALNGRATGRPEAPVDSKRIAAGICAIVIGTLGVQYFIIGKTAGGLLTILLSLCTCGLWGLVTLIQGIMMLTMSDEQFEEKYVYSPSSFPIF